MSFVEKALNRLKQQEKAKGSVRPVGTFRHEPVEEAAATASSEAPADTPAAAPPPTPTATTSVPEHPSAEAPPPADEHPARPSGTRPWVSFDRERFREEGFLSSEDHERVKAEEYRRIKRPLLAHAFGLGATKIEGGNLVLVSSALAGEGKTHTCINLALSLAAEKDRTVLLVDGDVAKPHISRLFGVDEQPGLLDALADEAIGLHDLLIHTDIDSLRVLPAGRWNEHATELLASDRMLKLCRELATRYPNRIIIFDSPPMLAATEAQAIAAAVGQVVLVIAEGLTPRESVGAALELIDENKPVNAVLNKSRRSAAAGYYGSYYGGYGDAREESSNVA